MTYYEENVSKKLYAPVDPKYLLYRYTAKPDDNDFLGNKVESIADKIRSLYGLLKEREDISEKVIAEVEEDIIDTSSKLVSYRYASFFDGRQKSNLERNIDLLEKTKRTELIDLWKDSFKINLNIFETVDEYNKIKNKRNLLQ